MQEGLIIRIAADGSKVTKTFNDLAADAKRFEKELKGASNVDNIIKLNKQLEGTRKQMDALKNYKGIIPPGAIDNTNRATQSLTDLSRVAQDAPYGFMAIANNLNPLFEGLGRLSTQAGGAKGALTAMLGALTGPAGIGLAIGVISSLLVKFGDSLFGSSEKAEDLTADIRALGQQAETAGNQIAGLQSDLAFLNQTANLRIKIAGGSDQSVLKAQIANLELTKQKIKEINVLTNVDAETLTNKLFEYKPGTKERDAAEEELDKLQKSVAKGNQEINNIEGQLIIARQQIRLADVEDQKEANEKAEAEREKALAKQKAYNEKLLRELKAAKDARDKLAALAFDTRSTEAPVPQNTADRDFQGDYIRNIRQVYEQGLGDPLPAFTIDEEDLKKFKDALAKQEADAKAFQDRMQSIFIGMGAGIAVGVGEGLAEALTGGDIAAAFAGIFATVGATIQQLGETLIQTAVAAQVFKKVFATLLQNPAAALAAGVGLVALGGVIKKTAIKIPKLAEGGIAYGNSFVNVGEYANAKSNPEVIAPLSKLKDILGKSGGEKFPAYLPVHKISGSELLLWYAKASKQQGRLS